MSDNPCECKPEYNSKVEKNKHVPGSDLNSAAGFNSIEDLISICIVFSAI